MRKLSLQLDALHVETFDTGAVAGMHGTVHANDSRITEFCNSRSCPNGCTVVVNVPPEIGGVKAQPAPAE